MNSNRRIQFFFFVWRVTQVLSVYACALCLRNCECMKKCVRVRVCVCKCVCLR